MGIPCSYSTINYIYALCCPVTGCVRYIGKSEYPAGRLKGHLRDSRRLKRPVNQWIVGLQLDGMAPTLTVLMSTWDWESSERSLIAQWRADGADLLNIAPGGNQPFCSSEQRARNGAANSKAIHSDPKRKRIWSLKRTLSTALARGELSPEVRAKLRLAASKAPHLFGAWAQA